MKYNKHVSTRHTPQSEPIPGKDMTQNNAGGFAFGVDKWTQLNRFLILGSEGGSYYVNESKMTKKNAKAVIECIKEDGQQVVTEVVGVSTEGRAPKNDPALFVLAMCAGLGDKQTRKMAFDVLPSVARIGTHLFHFAEFMEAFRGWGPMARKGIAKWYTEKDIDRLAYQMVKYQSRDGWSHRDILRLAHVKPGNPERNDLFKWATGADVKTEQLPRIVQAFEKGKVSDIDEIIELITADGLTREMIPSQFLNKPTVQLAMLQKGMPMTALIRNLGNLSKSGLLQEGKWDVTERVCNQITNEEALHKARVHPIQILIAMKTYAQGESMRGRGEWDVNQRVVSALDDAFYLSFKNVEPTGKRHLLGLDVSGSMGGGYYSRQAAGGLRPCEISAAMSMVRYKVEDRVLVRGFAHTFVDLGIGKTDRLDVVTDKVVMRNFGGTDCALPMLYALEKGLEIDVFEIYTDNETWYGDIHPVQALDKYRQKTGIPAKLVVIAATATEFSIADPNDAGMLDVAGFDASVPNIIHQFATNNL